MTSQVLAEYTRLEKIAATHARDGNTVAWEDAEYAVAQAAALAAQLPRTPLTDAWELVRELRLVTRVAVAQPSDEAFAAVRESLANAHAARLPVCRGAHIARRSLATAVREAEHVLDPAPTELEAAARRVHETQATARDALAAFLKLVEGG
jgi:hypothetical protein